MGTYCTTCQPNKYILQAEGGAGRVSKWWEEAGRWAFSLLDNFNHGRMIHDPSSMILILEPCVRMPTGTFEKDITEHKIYIFVRFAPIRGIYLLKNVKTAYIIKNIYTIGDFWLAQLNIYVLILMFFSSDGLTLLSTFIKTFCSFRILYDRYYCILVDFHQRPQRPERPLRGPPLLPPLGGAIRTGPGWTPLVLWPPRPPRCWPLKCWLPRWVVGSSPDNQSGGGTGLGGGGGVRICKNKLVWQSLLCICTVIGRYTIK
jgi:hypothetical protein